MTPPDDHSAPRGSAVPTAAPATQDDAATREYDELLRTAQGAWQALERSEDPSTEVSAGVLQAIKGAVRAEVRHGAQVEVPPTRRGPYTVSELSLRTLVRAAVDSVPGSRSLRSSIEHADPTDAGGRGLPEHIACRISADLSHGSLPALAERVREAVDTDLVTELGLAGLRIDIHIEDLHDQGGAP